MAANGQRGGLGWALVCGIGLCLCMAAPSVSGVGYTHQVWSADHGLPQHTVQALLPSANGYLWVGTRFGLARFDGVRFKEYPLPAEGGRRDNSVSALAEGGDGTIWVGTYGGLYAIRRGRIAAEPAVPMERVWALYVEGGAVWMSLAGGLGKLEDGVFRRLVGDGGPGPGEVRSLASDGRGGLLAMGPAGVWRLDAKTGAAKRSAIDWPAGEAPEAADRAGWIGRPMRATELGTVKARFAGGLRGGPNVWGPRLVSDPAGQRRWLIDPEGRLFEVSAAGVWQIHGEDPGFGGILCVHPDGEGNLWLGTATGGLVRLRRAVFALHSLDGDGDRSCFSVTPATEGGVWAAGRTRLHRLGGAQPGSWSVFGPLTAGRIQSVVPAARGGVWVGHEREGVFQWDGVRLTPAWISAEPRRRRARALLEARDGALWVGTRGGLARVAAGDAEEWGAESGLMDVGGLHETGDGVVWVGTESGGVQRWKGGRFEVLATAGAWGMTSVWGFLDEADGTVWLFGQGGLVRWRGGEGVRIGTEHGLFDALTNQMLADGEGSFWFGCNRGIYRVAARELHAVADGKAGRVSCIRYAAADGLGVPETNGEGTPSGAVTDGGILWFPSPVGVICAGTKEVPAGEVPPKVWIEEVEGGGGPVLDEAGLAGRIVNDRGARAELAPGEGRLMRFRYTSPSFAAPERVRFRHRLEGHDTDWVDAGARREAFYTNLRPGSYVFEVLAAGDHGLWAGVPARFEFELRPAFHQRAWFPVLVLGFAAASAFGAHRLRLGWVRRHLRLEHELRLARERERIARDMHDDVGAGLARIGLLVERAASADPGDGGTALDRLAAATREVGRTMDEIVWAVNPRNDRLEPLVGYLGMFAGEFLEGTAVRYRLDFPVALPDLPVSSEVRHQLLMIVREALANVVRHSGATSVTLRLVLSESVLEVEVRDDGLGLGATGAGRSGGGNGLRNMEERAAVVGGTVWVGSDAGRGTCVKVRLPLGLGSVTGGG